MVIPELGYWRRSYFEFYCNRHDIVAGAMLECGKKDIQLLDFMYRTSGVVTSAVESNIAVPSYCCNSLALLDASDSISC